jgi:GTP-binding protein
VRLLVLLTKADKIPRLAAQKALAAARETLAETASDEADIGVALFSALARTGVADAALWLRGWAQSASAVAATSALATAASAAASVDEVPASAVQAVAQEGPRSDSDDPTPHDQTPALAPGTL